MSYINLFFIAWTLTVLTEMLVYFCFIRLVWSIKTKTEQIIFAGIITSSCTLPYLWFVMPDFWSGNQLILIGEIIVFLVEIGILAGILRIGWRNSMILSLTANLASYGLGLIVMPYII